LINLKYLLLSKNQILTIELHSFDSLQSLFKLELSNNLIYSLNGKLFKEFKNLNLLDVSQNKLESLEKDDFYGLSRLETLRLNENCNFDLFILLFLNKRFKSCIFELNLVYLKLNIYIKI
jgi:Leucine-rich repeat (LRR) protein